MNKVLKELEAIKKIVATNDLLNVDEAAKFLGVSKRTIQNQSCPNGKLTGTFIINSLGHKMFYKSKLVFKN